MKYGLIGEKLAHSYSCEIHALIADYEYELKPLAKDEVGEFLKRKDFCAINITIPYKETVIPYLDVISEEARSIGAVNTIVNKNGKLFGYNTDFYGIKALVEKADVEIADKNVLILGTGGTAKTASAVMRTLGAKSVVKVSRTKKDDAIDYEEAKTKKDTQVIFNATPAGMYPSDEGCPIDLSVFDNLEGVLDAIYHPLSTNLVLQAREKGAKALGGLYMLVAQAVYASRLFLSKSIDDVDKYEIDDTYEKILAQKQNVVLVGMPSSGKSTIGKRVAKMLGREFVDTDDEIVKKINMPIAEFFAKYGEAEFRKIESEIVCEISKRSAIVVATGGGVVLDKNNVSALRRNGKIVFLNRSVQNLVATNSRPLSSNAKDLKNMFEQRYPIYKASADIEKNNDETVDIAVREIAKEFEK